MFPAPLLPVQFGVPGAMELAVLLIIFLLLAVPLGLVVLGVVYVLRRAGRSNDLDDRVDELEAEVESVKESIDEPRDR